MQVLIREIGWNCRVAVPINFAWCQFADSRAVELLKIPPGKNGIVTRGGIYLEQGFCRGVFHYQVNGTAYRVALHRWGQCFAYLKPLQQLSGEKIQRDKTAFIIGA